MVSADGVAKARLMPAQPLYDTGGAAAALGAHSV